MDVNTEQEVVDSGNGKGRTTVNLFMCWSTVISNTHQRQRGAQFQHLVECPHITFKVDLYVPAQRGSYDLGRQIKST